MSGVAAAAAVAAAVVAAAGAIYNGQQQAQLAQAQAQAQAYNYEAQAKANEYNATIQNNNARAALEQANAKEEANRRRFRILQGQSLAGVAQSGTGFDGSNALLLEQNELFNEMDALNIRYEGDMQSKGLFAQANLNKWNAGINRQNASSALATGDMTANSAITGSYFNAGSSLLSGVSNYYRLSAPKGGAKED